MHLTSDEYAYIESESVKNETTMSAFVRDCIRRQRFPEVFYQSESSEDYSDIRAEIREIQKLIKSRNLDVTIDHKMILNALSDELGTTQPGGTLEQRVLDALDMPRHLDELAERVHENPRVTLAVLTILRRDGVVAQDKTMHWRRI
ncbi:MAG: hypothetical protein ACTSU5_00965 [Promethearchaeota archaeon]